MWRLWVKWKTLFQLHICEQYALMTIKHISVIWCHINGRSQVVDFVHIPFNPNFSIGFTWID